MTKASENSVERLEIHLNTLFERGINLKERSINLKEDIDNDAFLQIDMGLTELESYSREPITIKINSSGGDVSHALGIVGRLKRSKCKIITEAYGQCMSAAALILACGKERRLSRFASFMWHESIYKVKGRHSQIMAEVAQKQKEEELWARWMAEFSKKSAKFYLAEGRHTDKFWSPEELLEFGLIDEII